MTKKKLLSVGIAALAICGSFAYAVNALSVKTQPVSAQKAEQTTRITDAKLDPTCVNLMKSAVPHAAGLQRAAEDGTEASSDNMTTVTTNLFEQCETLIKMGSASGTVSIEPQSFDLDFSADCPYYVVTGTDADIAHYMMFSEKATDYHATGTLTSTGEITLHPAISHLTGNRWRGDFGQYEIVLNADNNYTATFDISASNFPDFSPLGVVFFTDGSFDGITVTVSDMTFTSSQTIANATAWSEDTNLPGLGINSENMDVANCYTMQLDDAVTTFGIYLDGDNPIITGINTTASSVTMPQKVCINGKYYDFQQFGMENNAFDWSGAQSLTEIHLERVIAVCADLSSSPITDLYITYNSSFSYPAPETYLHIPYGLSRNNYSGFKRVFVGGELPSYPETTISDYVIAGDVEGEYFGITLIEGSFHITEIFSDNETVTLPNVTPYANEIYYGIGWLGNDNHNDTGTLCAHAPNLTTVVTDYCNKFDVLWENNPITTLYLNSIFTPTANFSLPATMTVYVDNKELYTSLESDGAWNRAKLMPNGWDFDWMTVNVARKGEFAQTYIEMTDADWSLGTYVKVTGTLSEKDLQNIKNLTSLRKLDLSEAVFDQLPDYFLSDCSTVNEVRLPETVSTISAAAFNYCPKLATVTAPGVSIVNDYAFNECNALTTFDISNVTYIGDYAFSNCNAFAPATFNSSLAYLGSNAFANTAITEVVIPESITEIRDYTFSNCHKLTTVTLPASIQTIGSAAFAQCEKLPSINLEEGLTRIGSRAFRGCASLTELTLPSTLNMIASDALGDCTSLLTVKSKAVVPPTANSTFTSGMDMNRCNLFVPPFSIDAYRAANGWNEFYIMKPLDEPVKNIYINRPMAFNLQSADNAVLQENPNMTLDYTNNDYNYDYSTSVGQLYAEGDGTLSAGNFTIRHKFTRRDNPSRDYRTTLINNAENMRADNVLCSVDFERNIWHFISFQYDVQMADVYGLNNTDFVIREYNAERRASATGEATSTDGNWDDVPADGVLLAGKGYIISAANNSTNESGNTNLAVVRFPSRNTTTKNNLFTSNNIIVPLEEHISEFAHNRSWNLVGNPYPCYYDMHYLQDDFTTPIVLWRGYGYQAYSPVDDDIVLRPNEAFFVQRPLDAEQMVFGVEGRLDYTQAMNLSVTPGAKAPAMTAAASDRAVFNFNFSGCGSDDRARIVMNEKASLAYETKYDAAKFFADNAAGIEAYVNSNVKYDICERPLAEGSAELAARFATEGEYTLSLAGRNTEGWTVMLADRLTGETVNLTNRDYTFRAEAGTCEGRFLVVFASPAQTSIDELSAFDANTTVRVFNTAGVNVFNGRIADFRATATPGVYVVEADGKNCKVVVK